MNIKDKIKKAAEVIESMAVGEMEKRFIEVGYTPERKDEQDDVSYEDDDNDDFDRMRANNCNGR
jgi:hypothetical protein